jgi:hypothetical protein
MPQAPDSLVAPHPPHGTQRVLSTTDLLVHSSPLLPSLAPSNNASNSAETGTTCSVASLCGPKRDATEKIAQEVQGRVPEVQEQEDKGKSFPILEIWCLSDL